MAERLIVDQEDVGSSPIRIATLRGVAQPGQSSRFGTEMPLVHPRRGAPTDARSAPEGRAQRVHSSLPDQQWRAARLACLPGLNPAMSVRMYRFDPYALRQLRPWLSG